RPGRVAVDHQQNRPLALGEVGLEDAGLPENLDAALVEAFRYRPEVKAIRARVRQARIEVERAKRAGLPNVDLGARWYGDDPGLALSSNWWVTLAVSWDLYDGGRRQADLMKARAALNQLRERDRKALLDVALDVQNALLGLEEARARHEVTVQAVSAAEESLAMVERQYRGGTATITRYLEAEEARTQARTRRIGSELDLNRAVIGVQRAIGRLGREGTR
ncbi:MAG: TolC family protein, partial [Planctomycetota bacterium]